MHVFPDSAKNLPVADVGVQIRRLPGTCPYELLRADPGNFIFWRK